MPSVSFADASAAALSFAKALSFAAADADADVLRTAAATKIQAKLKGNSARRASGLRKPERQMSIGTALRRASGEEPSQDAVRQFHLPGQKYFGFVKLFNQPLEDKVFYPRRYLAASHEIFLYTLVISFVVTLLVHPEQISAHPAKAIIGSVNPCFGWDYAPASYIAMVLCSTNVYFTWRYTWLSRTRIKLRNRGRLSWYEWFSFHGNVPLALASNFWLLLWLIGPTSDAPGAAATHAFPWMVHTGFFFYYAFSS